MSIPLPAFAHLYYEQEALAFPLAQRMRDHYRHIPQTAVDTYGEIFNRTRQHFQIQKRAQALILAVKQGHFLHRGTERIKSFGAYHVYYTDQMRNCIYNCDYCFLQGMHQSAHCVLFVNEDDYHQAVCAEIARHPEFHLSISYLSDLLAVEHVAPLCRGWVQVARRHRRLHIEIRTKSNNIAALNATDAVENVRLVWSLTPRKYAQRYEHGTASLPNRLSAARCALEHGWQVALCFDPIICGEDWQDEYRELFAETFRRLPAERIGSISYGTFRMHRNYFKRMLEQQPKNDMLLQGYESNNQCVAYDAERRQQLRETFEKELAHYYPIEKVFFVHG